MRRPPDDTSIRFEVRTADTAAELDDAVPVAFELPAYPDSGSIDIGALLEAGGQINARPHLRVTAILRRSEDGIESPVLTGFQLTYDCLPVE